MSYETYNDGPLRYAYTIGFMLEKKHTTAILY